ncbi:MAG: PorP/SprF family type IX secretion system membrane protein [Chitinophagaceae bacterium]
MDKVRIAIVFYLLLIMNNTLFGQDPNFSQFFSSPLNINPALTANISSDWRLISNIRNQWLGPASPYVTGTISFDSKIFDNKIVNVAENNFMGIGAMLMYDYAMSGIIKSTYGSLDWSYNIKLAEGLSKQRLAIGFAGTYGSRHVDFSKLDFQSQFTGTGFNTNLPTGEAALSNMKPYFALSAGLTYSFRTENSNLDMGISGFNLNRPKQTFLKDENQNVPIRKVAHLNFETYLNERTVLNTNGVYQYQSGASYFSVGGALGYFLQDEDKTMINAGLWYWSKNAIIPYFGFSYKDFQVGISYDITISKLTQATRKPSTWEISLILRGSKNPLNIIPCPWK